LALLEIGVLRRRRTGDINDIGDDWWAPAHSSWGVVFRRRREEVTYDAYEKQATGGMQKNSYLLLIQLATPHNLQNK
jgi:hypothetical protein